MYSNYRASIVLLAFCASFLKTADGAIPFFNETKKVIKVCTSSYTPMVYCDEATDPSTWSGYEVGLFRSVANILGWAENVTEWKCLTWEDMTTALHEPDGSCDVVAAGYSVSVDDIDLGVVYSWPTYKNGLAVSVSSSVESASMWAFTDAFEWQLWIAIIGTAVLVGFIVFAVDAVMLGLNRVNNQYEAGGGDKRKALHDYIWEALTRPTQVRQMESLSFASNLIILFFGFMCLVLVTIYTANTTANITSTRLQSTIRGVEDLPGKRVGAWEDTTDALLKYGIIAIPFPWETTEDEEVMVNALLSGSIQALVLDESFLMYRASNSCDLAVVGAKFYEYDQAIAFPKGFDNPDLLNAVNAALVELREEGILDDLHAEFVAPPEAKCKTSLMNEGATKISWTQVAGLWIMLGGGICLAIVIAIIHKLHVRYTRRHISKVGSQLKRQMSRALSGSGNRRGDDRIASLDMKIAENDDEHHDVDDDNRHII